ncbi:MAG: hypothetical protein QOH70_1396 [Blastocatellia bacterium]|nr:hypothetical protein [Blastocatellia bacterium]
MMRASGHLVLGQVFHQYVLLPEISDALSISCHHFMPSQPEQR